MQIVDKHRDTQVLGAVRFARSSNIHKSLDLNFLWTDSIWFWNTDSINISQKWNSRF